MRFISIKGGLVNAAHVTRIMRQPKTDFAMIYINGSDDPIESGNSFEEVRAQLVPIVPDHTGLKAVLLFHDENEQTAAQVLPIVAWSVEPEGAAPICAGNTWVDHVILEDGSVLGPLGETYATVDALVAVKQGTAR